MNEFCHSSYIPSNQEGICNENIEIEKLDFPPWPKEKEEREVHKESCFLHAFVPMHW